MKSPNIEHIQYFITVVETGSFTKASKKLRKDRSSIGQAIALLEIDLGVSLFTRNGPSIKVTNEGEALYKRARSLIQNYQSFCHFGHNLCADSRETMRIGVDSFTSPKDIAVIDRALYENYPALIVNWVKASAETLGTMLQKDELDFAIRKYNNRTLPEGYSVAHLDDVKLVAVTSPMNLDREPRDLPIFFFDGLDEVILSTHFAHSQEVPDATTALSILEVKPGTALIPESMLETGKHKPIAIHGAHHLIIRRVLLWYHNLQLNPEKRFLINNIMNLLHCK